ncbi:MAG TPA: DNA alkylation repair protein [Candidatus Pacearchaeota archaeon]|nr:DNA alkylation repair enzyme [archaeon BMS3Abin17]HDK41837.1 DNA alkylation repair protein [Candidatus Pacearchaeota archaeon]HDZ60529.1 DNA alkylation repair protein [Candidatus Pacearchaeota archaeon]
MLDDLKKELQKLSNPKQAKLLQGFFKTGEGQYGEGDIFLGIKVPIQRGVAKRYKLPLNEIQELLNSKIHEHRLIGLFILISSYKKSNNIQRRRIFNFYLKNTKNINNWDLVDLSAPNIVGDYLVNKDRKILYKLTKSNNLWEKRVAVLATFAFIRKKDFKDSLKISKLLLKDTHDLIHKAVGWMLREIGKRNQEVEEEFLKKHYKEVPRTMLRYAIERFPEDKRKKYLKGEI